jgi:hypothetical protein
MTEAEIRAEIERIRTLPEDQQPDALTALLDRVEAALAD